MSQDDGGPAFPRTTEYPMQQLDRDTGNITDLESGMSLLDHYAGLAMQQLCRDLPKMDSAPNHSTNFQNAKKELVARAWDVADSMILRKRETEKEGKLSDVLERLKKEFETTKLGSQIKAMRERKDVEGLYGIAEDYLRATFAVRGEYNDGYSVMWFGLSQAWNQKDNKEHWHNTGDNGTKDYCIAKAESFGGEAVVVFGSWHSLIKYPVMICWPKERFGEIIKDVENPY